jgi:hypothetical protein
MKVVSTTISETYADVRLADDSDSAKAAEWIEIRVPLASLKIDDAHVLKHPQSRRLGGLQRAALAHVQSVIGGQIEALDVLLHTPV